MSERFFGIERRLTDRIEANLGTIRRAVVLFERDSRRHEETPDGAAVRRTMVELSEIARHLEGMIRRVEERLGL